MKRLWLGWLAVRKLVALALRGGERFLAELQRAWNASDAVLVVDERLPLTAQQNLVARMGASVLVDDDGRHRLRGGWPVEDGDALVMATSGSTGKPKGVVLTHEAVRANVDATCSALGVDPTADCWLACLPLAHVGGLSVVARALLTDTPLVMHPRFDARAVEQAARAGATLASLVPTALARIDPGLFRRVLVGGSAVPVDRPSNVVATYGMTETFSGVVYDGWPLDGVELRVVDGEVQLRCEMLCRAYRHQPGIDAVEGLAKRLPDSPVDGHGWFATGDAGELSAEGQLRVFGRRDDLIITGGQNVWPVAVERALADVAGVAALAVTGRDDPEWGQRVTAVVVPADPASPPALEVLAETVKQTLPAYCAPKSLEIVAALPTTPLGKVKRHEL